MVVAATSLLKLLFMPCYRSTDFEVHRNWLAVTHSLPPNRWYKEATSEWTLDYPPLFAAFEWALSQVAVFFDPEMLKIGNMNYESAATIVFQRLSVIVTDLILALGVLSCHKGLKTTKSASSKALLMALTLCNAGLLIVDHIHFQYNGFLFGVALLSIGNLMQDHVILSGFWFAVLLNLKHIYLYSAPLYFIYMLRHYCLVENALGRLLALGSSVIAVFAISFGPFVYMGQTFDVLARLFPFKRGLCHAYWAPNFWALYNVADKVLLQGGLRLGLVSSKTAERATMTRGLVEEFEHAVLPSIPPLFTFILAATSMVPVLWKVWRSPRADAVLFLRGLVLCNFGSFLFGWHVHEKAILLVIIPMTVLAFMNKADADDLFLLSTIGHVSLLPLIFTVEERLLRIIIVVAFAAGYKLAFDPIVVNFKEKVYLKGLVFIVAFESLGSHKNMAFLPLLLYSIYCSVGLIYCWLRLYNRTCCTSYDMKAKKSN